MSHPGWLDFSNTFQVQMSVTPFRDGPVPKMKMAPLLVLCKRRMSSECSAMRSSIIT